MAEETKTGDAPATLITEAKAPAAEVKAEVKPEVKADASTTPAKTEEKAIVPVDFKYEAKDPLLDPSEIAEVAQLVKDGKLKPEDAKAQLDQRNSSIQKFYEAKQEAFKKEQSTWVETAKNDKEIGGKEFGKNVELAKRFLDKFFDEPFKKELDKTGLGNHPELLRGFIRAGKAMSEDSFIRPPATPGTGEKKSLAERLYPTEATA